MSCIEGADLAEQLSGAIRNIRGTYAEAELPDLGEDETIVETIPADPNVRNFSYTVVDGELYYRQNSIMTKPDFNATAKERAKGMVELRDCGSGWQRSARSTLTFAVWKNPSPRTA